MSLEQSKALKEAFDTAADANGYISWLKCMQIAKELGLEYEQVCFGAVRYSEFHAGMKPEGLVNLDLLPCLVRFADLRSADHA